MIRVGVFGAGGRMGGEVCRAVHEAPGMVLAAAVDPRVAGQQVAQVAGISGNTLLVSEELDAMLDGDVDVAVDFTSPDSAEENAAWCIRHAMHVIVGTTGIPPSGVDALAGLLEEEGGESNVFIAPNFALGAVLLMQFAKTAAAWFPNAEVIELHHDHKKDAPSGTSLAILDEIVAGRDGSPEALVPASEVVEMLEGSRGGERGGVHIHSVRLPGFLAHHEVIFGGQGQTLTIRHDSMNRTSFMPGVLLAIREIDKHPGLTIGLHKLLGL